MRAVVFSLTESEYRQLRRALRVREMAGACAPAVVERTLARVMAEAERAWNAEAESARERRLRGALARMRAPRAELVELDSRAGAERAVTALRQSIAERETAVERWEALAARALSAESEADARALWREAERAI